LPIFTRASIGTLPEAALLPVGRIRGLVWFLFGKKGIVKRN
jgi:hypothetical protein